jgi:[ribosomal protein S5]-alanine N-acetyltransferase
VSVELVTERLRLLPITFEIADAALNDRELLSELTGARVTDDWPNPDFADALSFVRADVRRHTSYSEWQRLLVHSEDEVIVGDAGFKSLPDEHGSVEVGYGIIPPYRKQGLALEATAVLVEWAWGHSQVHQIVAECLLSNEASRRVLERLGMERTGEEATREGLMLKWRLLRP